MMNANFICNQGFAFSRTFQFMECGNLPFPLAGFGIDFYVKAAAGGTTLFHASIGNGITVDMTTSTATLTMTASQTAALSTTGLSVLSVTEYLGSDCCDGTCGPDQIVSAIGPTAFCYLTLTDPAGNVLPPEFSGLFAIVPQP